MKNLSILLLLTMSLNAYTFVIWPDAEGRCNSTLQDCIDGSLASETIEVRTSNVINENIFSSIPLSLKAGQGFSPIIAANNNITFSVNTGSTASVITVQGFKLEMGNISIVANGAVSTNILNNEMSSPPNTESIRVFSSDNNDISVYIKYNLIDNSTTSAVNFSYGAISVVKEVATSGVVSGEIYGNTISAIGVDSRGITLVASTNADFDFKIVGNTITGGTQAGIFVDRFNSTTGMTNVDIISNVFYPDEVFLPSGVHVVSDSGTIRADIINNTMVKCRWGIQLLIGSSATLEANVYNNIVAFGSIGFEFQTGVSVTNNYNLSYDNNFNTNYTPGINAISANPELMGFNNARLRPSSPAIEAGSTFVFVVSDSPLIDADGTYRIKKATSGTGSGSVDIGAYETGNLNFLFKNIVDIEPSSISSPINHVELNGNAALDDLHITAGNGGLGHNNANEGLYFDTAFWSVFNEDQTTDISDEYTFNLTKFANSPTTFKHTSTEVGQNNTVLNRSGLDNNPDAILQVTQTWTGVYNPHPPSVLYLSGKWRIINNDLAIMPTGSMFNVYFQPKSKSAFEHIVKMENNNEFGTYLDNPLLNNTPCAQIQVTQSSTQGVFNNAPIHVYYSLVKNKWAIHNQDLSIMPENAAFHVVFDPAQIAECTDVIFKDDFEN